MKTKLLCFALTIAVAFLFIATSANAQNKFKTKDVKNATALRDNQGSSHPSYPMLPAEDNSSKAACDTLNLNAYKNTWTVVDYSVTATPQFSLGFVNGVNTYGDKAKAAYFPNTGANTYCLGGMIAFSKAYASNPAKTITVNLYSVSGGNPSTGTPLASKTLTMAEVMSDVNGNYFTVVDFASPVLVSGQSFFMGVDFSGLDWTTFHDTLSIQSNSNGQTTPTATWEKQSDNLWYSYTNTASWNLNISLAIFPVMCNVPANAVFTQSATNTCTGYPVSLNAAASTQTSVYWELPGGNPATSNIVAPTVTYAAAGTYPIKLYVLGGSCNNLDSLITSVTVIASPNPNATATPPAVCLGNSSVLSAANGISYQWNGYPLGPTPNQTVTPNITTTYTVTVTGSNGCSASQNAAVTINPPPAPNAIANPALLCEGNSVLISTAPGMSLYAWTPGGATTAAFTASPTVNTTYTVSVTDAMGCTATDNVLVTVDPEMVTTMATTDAICGNSDGTATVAVAYGGTGPYTGQWSTSPIQYGFTATGLAQGTYYVTVTDFNGCTIIDTANVGCVVGLAGHASGAEISILPNPSSGECFLMLDGYNGVETGIDIYNVDGQHVYTEMIKVDADVYTRNINLGLFAKGVYYLKVTTNNNVKTIKLLTQ